MKNKTIKTVPQLQKELEDMFKTLVNKIQQLDESTINEVKKKGTWSIGQIVEHIVICSGGIPDQDTEYTSRAIDEHIPALKAIFLDMATKYQADASISPTSPPHNKKQLIIALEQNRNLLQSTAATQNLNMLCKAMELPGLGYLTRYEWLLFIIYHTQRHIRQIENLINQLQPKKTANP